MHLYQSIKAIFYFFFIFKSIVTYYFYYLLCLYNIIHATYLFKCLDKGVYICYVKSFQKLSFHSQNNCKYVFSNKNNRCFQKLKKRFRMLFLIGYCIHTQAMRGQQAHTWYTTLHSKIQTYNTRQYYIYVY